MLYYFLRKWFCWALVLMLVLFILPFTYILPETWVNYLSDKCEDVMVFFFGEGWENVLR